MDMKLNMSKNFKPIEAAIKKAGSQAALAKQIGVSQGFVNHMLLMRNRVPARLCIPIEQATGVSRHELRPDIYPR